MSEVEGASFMTGDVSMSPIISRDTLLYSVSVSGPSTTTASTGPKSEFVTDDKMFTSKKMMLENKITELSTILLSPFALLAKPVKVFTMGIFIALVYVLIPNGNYWNYHILKSSIWIVSGTVWAVETMEACYPDTADLTYTLCYLVGLISPIVFYSAAFSNVAVRNNFAFSVFAISGVVFWTPCLFLIDIFVRPPPAISQRPMVSYGLSDLFVAALDADREASLISSLFPKNNNNNNNSNNNNNMNGNMSIYQNNNSNKSRNAGSIFGFGRETMAEILSESSDQSICENGGNKVYNDSEKMLNPDERRYSNARMEWYEEVMRDSTSRSMSSRKYPDYSLLTGIAKYAWFLPRFRHRAAGRKPAVLVGYTSSTVQVLFGLIFSILYICNFYFLMFFTVYFRELGGSSVGQKMSLLIIFVMINTVFRISMKRMGMIIDQRKKQGISLFFIAETICLMFYYTFYRVIFESVQSWVLFFAVQLMHLSFEWISYPFRGSSLFYFTVVQLRQRYGSFIPDLVESSKLNNLDWQLFLSLDFAIRVWVMVFSSLGMLLIFFVVDNCIWIDNALRQSNSLFFRETAIFIILATILEVLNAVLIVKVFFQPNRLSLSAAANKCFSDIRFGSLVSAIVLVCFLNPISVFTTNNTYE